MPTPVRSPGTFSYNISFFDLITEIEVRLNCRAAENKSVSSRGRPQKGALLQIKLREPLQRSQWQQEIDAIYPVDNESSSMSDPIAKLVIELNCSQAVILKIQSP